MGPSHPNVAATHFRMVTVDFPRRITAVEARQSIWFQVGWLWWGDVKCWEIWKIWRMKHMKNMTVYCVWFICIYWLVYLFYVFFLKWSDKRILCDLLVLMITTLWLCFSHDDNMIWHNMTCSSTMGHTGKQFGLVKEFEDSRSRYQGCYMICKI